jgi:cysteine desulfuration protein SufE
MNVVEEIVSDFNMFDTWEDKYAHLIELGNSLSPMLNKDDSMLVKGCVSQVWLDFSVKDGRVYFYADSDALITKGLISLLIKVLSGLKASEIVDFDMKFVNKIGLMEHLSPSRANGLNSMIKRMKEVASNVRD